MISGGPTWLTDGFRNQVGGMDSSKSADLIAEDYYALGINVAARGGKPHTRPRFKRSFFSATDDALDIVRQRPFLGGISYYDANTASPVLIGVFGGKVIRMDPAAGTASNLTPSDSLSFYPFCWLCQAENFLVIQNGVDIPLIYDGSTIRRSKTGTGNPNKTITSLTQVAGLATVTVAAGHGFTTGDYVQIEGVTPDGYNGEAYVTVTGTTTFTYAVTSTLASPATVTTSVCRWCPEVPAGTEMVYTQGRLFVASADRKTFKAGDIIYGDPQGVAANLLRFSEEIYLAEGGDFALPATMGRIVSMDAVPQQDTATGQGELLVLGEYGAASFNVAAERSTWQTSQIQRVTFSEVGAVSSVGTVSVNNDLLFRTPIGIRSYRQARADQNNYGQTPLSAELNRVLDLDTKTALYRTSAINFENRMLMTCGPVEESWLLPVGNLQRSGTTLTVTTAWPHNQTAGHRISISGSVGFDGSYVIGTVVDDYNFTVTVAGGIPSEEGGTARVSGSTVGTAVYHRGLASLDFTSLSGIGGKTSAGYDGVWTGLRFLQVVTGLYSGNPRAFTFVSDDAGENSVWEITNETGHDLADTDSPVPQQCVVETRSFDFQKPYTLKKLLRGDLWLSDIRGEVALRVLFRMDNHPCWTEWATKTVCATVDDPLVNEADPLSVTTIQGLPQRRAQIRLTTPPDACDEATGQLLRMGFAAQIRIEWTGTCKLEKLLVHALEQAEQVAGGPC